MESKAVKSNDVTQISFFHVPFLALSHASLSPAVLFLAALFLFALSLFVPVLAVLFHVAHALSVLSVHAPFHAEFLVHVLLLELIVLDVLPPISNVHVNQKRLAQVQQHPPATLSKDGRHTATPLGNIMGGHEREDDVHQHGTYFGIFDLDKSGLDKEEPLD